MSWLIDRRLRDDKYLVCHWCWCVAVMSHDPMITVAANIHRVQNLYQEENLKKSCEAFRFYLEKILNLELPYSNENLKYINGLLVNMGNMLMLQNLILFEEKQ